MSATDAQMPPKAWFVVLYFCDPSGAPHPLVYEHVQGDSREAAIDRALGNLGQLERYWTIPSAWAAPQSAVGDRVQLEPVPQPQFRRREP